MNFENLRSISNHDLLQSLHRQVEQERKVSHQILLHLKEIEARRLYVDRGFSSLMEMLIKEFRFSEGAAYRRVQAMRLLKAVPQAEVSFQKGEVTLSTLAAAQCQIRKEEAASGAKVAVEKKQEILESLKGKTQAQVAVELHRLLPLASEIPQCQVRRVGAEQTRLSLTIDDSLLSKLNRLKGLWAHKNPAMDWPELLERLADFALDKCDPMLAKATRSRAHENNNCGSLNGDFGDRDQNEKASETSGNSERSFESMTASATGAKAQAVRSDREVASFEKSQTEVERPQKEVGRPQMDFNWSQTEFVRPETELVSLMADSRFKKDQKIGRRRYFSVHLRRTVWQRGGGQCEFVDGLTGRRCEGRFGLEIDHRIPLAKGGTDEISNLRLLCKTHNIRMAERHFGRRKIIRAMSNGN